MCYASPGPRCAKVASERMKKAKLSGDARRIRETTEQYLLTIPGINTLKKRGYHDEAARYRVKRDELIAASKSGPQEDTSDHPNISKQGKYLVPKEEYTDEEITDIIRARFRRGGWTPTEIKKMYITPSSKFDATFGSSSMEISFDYNHPLTQSWFSRGQCARLAYEMSKRTGRPMIVWTNTNHDDWEGHAAIEGEDGTVVDVLGVHTHDEVIARYRDNGADVSGWAVTTMEPDEQFLNMVGVKDEHELYGGIDDAERAVVSHVSTALIREHGLNTD